MNGSSLFEFLDPQDSLYGAADLSFEDFSSIEPPPSLEDHFSSSLFSSSSFQNQSHEQQGKKRSAQFAEDLNPQTLDASSPSSLPSSSPSSSPFNSSDFSPNDYQSTVPTKKDAFPPPECHFQYVDPSFTSSSSSSQPSSQKPPQQVPKVPKGRQSVKSSSKSKQPPAHSSSSSSMSSSFTFAIPQNHFPPTSFQSPPSQLQQQPPFLFSSSPPPPPPPPSSSSSPPPPSQKPFSSTSPPPPPSSSMSSPSFFSFPVTSSSAAPQFTMYTPAPPKQKSQPSLPTPPASSKAKKPKIGAEPGPAPGKFSLPPPQNHLQVAPPSLPSAPSGPSHFVAELHHHHQYHHQNPSSQPHLYPPPQPASRQYVDLTDDVRPEELKAEDLSSHFPPAPLVSAGGARLAPSLPSSSSSSSSISPQYAPFTSSPSPPLATLLTPPMSETESATTSAHFSSSASASDGDINDFSDSPNVTPPPSRRSSSPFQPQLLAARLSEEPGAGGNPASLPHLTQQSLSSASLAEGTTQPLFGSFKVGGGASSASHLKGSMVEEGTQAREEKMGAPVEKLQRHNESEKKRRESMNDYITTLRNLVPSLHTVQKPSKGTILHKTVEYVTRIQQKNSELTRLLHDTNEKALHQQNTIETLLQRLAEHGIPLPEDVGAGQNPSKSSNYYVQEAGRSMVLMAACLFFCLAPWQLPTSTAEAAAREDSLSGGRGLLSVPMAVFDYEGWIMFFLWLFIRWVVMTSLLTIALFSDTMYCSQDLKRSLAGVQGINEQTREAILNGNYLKANRLTNEALLLLNRPIPNSSFDLFFGIIYQAGRQIAHRAYIGLIVDRFLLKFNGQMGYASQLKDTYLNLSKQAHCLPNYNKWTHLYALLCCINLAELLDETGDVLVQAYAGLAYLVVVHSKVLDFFANLYMHLAYRIINRGGIESSRFGRFHIIVAYRHLLCGNFEQAFENIQKGIDMHNAFGLSHHSREYLMMKGWIQHILAITKDSQECFKIIYENGRKDCDKDSELWGILGMVANYKSLGENEKAREWLECYNSVLDESKSNSGPSNQQTSFIIGFKASLFLREGIEDGALEVADSSLELLRQTVDSGMPHNVLPLHNIAEVHFALLEKHIKNPQSNSKELIDRLITSCRQEVELIQQSVILFSLMRPLYSLYYGRFIYLTTGNQPKAISYLKKTAQEASKFKLRQLYALALFEWARILPIDSIERADKLEEALGIFSDIDFLYEEQLTRAEMKRKSEEDYVDRVFIVKYHELS